MRSRSSTDTIHHIIRSHFQYEHIPNSQYTSFYKTQRNLSTLPVRAHFDETRYKNKKPIPTNNTYIAVEGFLNNVIVDSKSGTSTIFHFSVDNISFLGKAVLPNKCKSR